MGDASSRLGPGSLLGALQSVITPSGVAMEGVGDDEQAEHTASSRVGPGFFAGTASRIGALQSVLTTNSRYAQAQLM